MIVYTVIHNEYDNLKDFDLPKGWRAYVLTDKVTYPRIKSRVWQPILCELPQRYLKLVPPFFDSDYTIYVDGSIQLLNIQSLFEEYKSDFAVLQHRVRNNLRDEVLKCIDLKKAPADKLKHQYDTYCKAGYQGKGMYETGLMIRRNSLENRLIGIKWYEEILKHTKRDQVSFGYIMQNFNFTVIPKTVHGKYIQVHRHVRKNV